MLEAEISHRRVLAIALPILLANMTVPLLGLADTAVIGQLGRADMIGTVAIGAVLLGSSYWVFGFLRMGTSGLVAQARGARDAAMTYLPWVVLAPIIGLACWMLDGIFIGATRTREMRNAAIVAMGIFGLALWSRSAIWGNHGIWAALMISYVARALMSWMYYPKLEAAAQPAL